MTQDQSVLARAGRAGAEESENANRFLCLVGSTPERQQRHDTRGSCLEQYGSHPVFRVSERPTLPRRPEMAPWQTVPQNHHFLRGKTSEALLASLMLTSAALLIIYSTLEP